MRGNYWLAVVSDGGDQQEFHVQWLFNPLRELEPLWQSGKVQVEYTWKATVPADREQPWEVVNAPSAGAPSNFSFKVPHEPRTDDSAQFGWIDETKKRLQALPGEFVDGG